MKLWFDTVLMPISKEYIKCTTPFLLKAYISGNWNQISVINLCYGEKPSATVDSSGISMLKWLESIDGKDTYGKVKWEICIHNSTKEQIEEMEEIILRNNWRYNCSNEN